MDIGTLSTEKVLKTKEKISIDIKFAYPSSGRKKRSLMDDNEVVVDDESQYVFPFIERISEMGITNLYKDKSCQQRLFCDMANYGQKRYAKDKDEMKTPNIVQNMFGTVSHK